MGLKHRHRRAVSNDEFNDAYYGRQGDMDSMKSAADNRGIIGGVTKLYIKHLTKDELRTCGMHALWRCLQYHNETFGQKFTTSLHRFVMWECQREMRRKYGRGRKNPDSFFLPIFQRHLETTSPPPESDETDARVRLIGECIDQLPRGWQKKVVKQYYIRGMTMEQIGKRNGYSKEAARQRVIKATRVLKELCHESM